MIGINANHGLRIGLAGQLGHDRSASFDDFATCGQCCRFDLFGQRVRIGFVCDDQGCRRSPRFQRLGQDTQSFGEKKTFILAVFFLAQAL